MSHSDALVERVPEGILQVVGSGISIRVICGDAEWAGRRAGTGGALAGIV